MTCHIPAGAISMCLHMPHLNAEDCVETAEFQCVKSFVNMFGENTETLLGMPKVLFY